jgi:pectinesterase
LAFIQPESVAGEGQKSISAATFWFGFGKKENPEI